MGREKRKFTRNDDNINGVYYIIFRIHPANACEQRYVPDSLGDGA